MPEAETVDHATAMEAQMASFSYDDKTVPAPATDPSTSPEEEKAAAKDAPAETEKSVAKDDSALPKVVRPVKSAAEAESGEQDEEEEEEKPRVKNSAQERINKAVGRQRAAERARDEAVARFAVLESRLAAVEKGNLTTPAGSVNDDVAPDPQKFTYGELDTKFIAATARYHAKQALEEARTKATQEAQAAKSTSAQTALREKQSALEAEGLARYADFDEVVVETAKRGEWPLSNTLHELILDSPAGSDVAYFLASNRKDAQKIAALSPARQAAWFGQQEAELSSKPSDAGTKVLPKTTQAPASLPNRAKGSGGRNNVSADTSDFAAFEAMVRGR
jgi:hypothetical protein